MLAEVVFQDFIRDVYGSFIAREINIDPARFLATLERYYAGINRHLETILAVGGIRLVFFFGKINPEIAPGLRGVRFPASRG